MSGDESPEAKEKKKMKLSTMMKKAIDYFEKTKPEGAEIRGCTPWEFYEGSEAGAIIRIEYARRNAYGEMDYTESDEHPLQIHIHHKNGKTEIY